VQRSGFGLVDNAPLGMANQANSAATAAEMEFRSAREMEVRLTDQLQLYAYGLVVADPLGMASQANSAAQPAEMELRSAREMEVRSARHCPMMCTFWRR